MANGYTNTVPLGREGTGAATILGPNRALQYFLQQNATQQNRQYAAEERYQRQQQAYDSQFQKTLMELGELSATPMYTQDFAELTNQLVRQGGELMAQGINPYNPYQNEGSRAAVQQWQGEVNRLRSAKSLVDNMYKERQTQVKQYLTNPDQYDFEDFKQLRDFEKDVSLEDILSGTTRLPQLAQRLNISQEIGKQYGDIYVDSETQGVDASGNPVRVTVREPDVNRIMRLVEGEFTPTSRYGQEVNRRLRREFGEGATINGLLGTTNRDEIRQILDAEFRNPSSDNPLVELMANGVNARPGTPQYESFLEQAVNEQLRAETILDDAKQEAASSLMQRVNPSRKERLDFTLRNQQLRERAANRADRQLALSEAREARLRESATGANTADITYVGSESVPIGSRGRENSGRTPIRNAVNFYNTEVSVTGGDAYNMNSRESYMDTPSIRGKIVKLAEYPFDSTTGELLDESQVSSNPNVEYRKMAQIDDDGLNILVPASKIPVTLPAGKQKIVNEFLRTDDNETSSQPSSGVKASQQTLDLFR